MPALAPTYTARLFRPLLDELLALLRGLSAEQWAARTVAGAWCVRDVAAHLLDGDLRKIAVFRDGYAIPTGGPIASAADLSRFVNGTNASGVAFAARLSPRLLADLLEVSGRWVAEVLEALPPHAPARYGVSWAGEAVSATGSPFASRTRPLTFPPATWPKAAGASAKCSKPKPSPTASGTWRMVPPWPGARAHQCLNLALNSSKKPSTTIRSAPGFPAGRIMANRLPSGDTS